jgi:bacterioferritin
MVNPIIKELNQVLLCKLTSINQFFLHARICKDWGLNELDEFFYKNSIKDMKHSDSLIERILLLGGLPNLQALGRLRIGENTIEVLECNLGFIQDQHEVIKSTISLCEKAQDYVSRDLLVEFLDYEEERIDWTETQQSLINNVGIQNYNQSQMGNEA